MELVIAGGLLKNSLLMQIYADVTNLPLSTIVSSQAPPSDRRSMRQLRRVPIPTSTRRRTRWGPPCRRLPTRPEGVAAYDELYREYVTLHDYFGRGGNEVMHRLKEVRRRVAGEATAP